MNSNLRGRLVRSATALAATAALSFSALLATPPPLAEAAEPASPPVAVQRTADTVTADALPTVQIDSGYIWAQTMIGNTVYAVGSFSNARAPLAAPGQQLTPRSNVLAYDITTGQLNSSFAPTVNGVVRSVAASPDGSRIYIGGSFNQVNGQTRWNVAALDARTGALIAGVAPAVGGTGVYAMSVNATTWFIGGKFTQTNGVARRNLAAVATSNGALQAWAPTTDLQVDAMVLDPVNGNVVAGGRFEQVNGVTQRGLVSLFTASGQIDDSFAAPRTVINGRSSGDFAGKAGIFALNTDATGIYGTGWVYANVATGNLEGVFAAEAGSGAIRWVADCHGDNYGVYSSGTDVYSTHHVHACETTGLWPEQNPRTYRYVSAFSATAEGILSRSNQVSDIYKDWSGTPSPAPRIWYPDFTVGTASGLGQAGLSITGKAGYISVAGEFTTVNNQRYQGIVRFSTNPSTGKKQGPRMTSDWPAPTATSVRAGRVQVSIPANWDRDDRDLFYELRRTGVSTPIATKKVASGWWDRPIVSFSDTGLPAGSTQSYRITVKDADGNQVTSATSSVVVSNRQETTYQNAVLADDPSHFWTLSETDGTVGIDWGTAPDNLAIQNGGARGVAGKDSSTATRFTGADDSFAANSTPTTGPSTFSVEAWFNTTSNRGGKIVGFGNQNTGISGSYDRHVYLSSEGHVVFGVYPNDVRTVMSGPGLNDGQWHHVVGTLGPNGQELWIDGRKVDSRTDTTSAQDYQGFWRVGSDNLGGWPYANAWGLDGAVSDVAVYTSVLGKARIDAHYAASGRASTIKPAPSDAYGKAVYDLEPTLYWRLGESNKTVAEDSSNGGMDGRYSGDVTARTGAIQSVSNGATAFRANGGDANVIAEKRVNGPNTFSVEAWISTTTFSGGKIVGFGDAQQGWSGNYDRHMYMGTDGRVRFGSWTGFANIVSSQQPVNDGRWHHVVATQGPAGMRLYVDGVLQDSNSNTSAQPYSGYWRVGGDSPWEGDGWFNGSVDEVAVYSTPLTQAQAAEHYQLGSTVPNQAPSADFTSTVDGLGIAVNGGGSTDPDGTITGYAWEFGDGATASTVNATHTYAASGTYAVKLTVTDNAGATASTEKTVTVVKPNDRPVAAFTSQTNGLAVSVDGSSSTDADGTISTWSWKFGDGTTASGRTAERTYAAAGTYTVELTVTDDKGATATTTKDVTVAPIPNQKPTAAFTSQVDALKVSVDGSSSTDADGTISTWSWKFGDGTTASGRTAERTYTAAGTYTVELTVTDDKGDTDTSTKQVTVAAAPVDRLIAKDDFGRSVSSGWGTAETGGPYTVSGGAASAASVSGGTGRVLLAPSGTRNLLLAGVSARDVDLSMDVSLDHSASVGNAYTGLIARRNGAEDYTVRAWLRSDGSVWLVTQRSGTVLQSVRVAGMTRAAGDQFTMRVQVVGSGTSTIRAKIWRAGSAEPTAWQVTSTDSTPGLQVAGGVGVHTNRASSATGNGTFQIDNLRVTELA